VDLALPREVSRWSLREREFPQSVLDDCFPYRGDTQVHLVSGITDRVPEGDRQQRIGADVPEEDVGIEQKPHAASKSLRISSGRGRSKSGGAVNRPAHRPKGRG